MRLDHNSSFSAARPDMHAETLRECGRSKLPFAGYSVVRFALRLRRRHGSLTRLSGTTLRAFARFGELVGDMPRRSSERSRSPRQRRTGPQAASLPVVIGSGSHPFPFRTRKLSLIPPMVLHGKLCGRVGRCRHYFRRPDVERRRAFFAFDGSRRAEVRRRRVTAGRRWRPAPRR